MTSANVPAPVRVFVDSNVLIEGLFAAWSASRAILVLSRAGVLRLVLSPYVEEEVERALLKRYAADEREGSKLIDDYALALELLQPERLTRVTKAEFIANRGLIRHGNDVPVLVTAIKSRPDWLVTANIAHFTPEVARRTALRIVTPQAFLKLFGIQT